MAAGLIPFEQELPAEACSSPNSGCTWLLSAGFGLPSAVGSCEVLRADRRSDLQAAWQLYLGQRRGEREMQFLGTLHRKRICFGA